MRAAPRAVGTAVAVAVALVLPAGGPSALLPPVLAIAIGQAGDALAEPVLQGPPPAGWPAAPTIDAAAFLLVDAATGQVLAEGNADERRPVASTVKVLTALTVVRRSSLDDEVTVGDEVVDVEGASVGLVPGDTWSVEQLLEAIIALSGNDAAEALAVHVAGSREAFIDLMAEDAASVGVTGVTLVSPSGLDDGNLLSANDLARIGRAALSDPELRPLLARTPVSLPGVGVVDSRNELLERYPGATGLKTGFTLEAGNSFVGSARRDGRELVVVVLDAGEDPARFERAAELLDFGFEHYQRTELAAVVEVALAGGTVAIEAAPSLVTIPAGSDARLRAPIPARPPEDDVEVPIEVDGIPVGEVTGVVSHNVFPVPDQDATAVGRAMVDGAYAALRAAAATGRLR